MRYFIPFLLSIYRPKKHTLLSCIALFLCLTNPTYGSFFVPEAQQQKLFSGSIRIQQKLPLDFCLFYKGEKLVFDPQVKAGVLDFTFTDSKSTHTIHIIITEAVTHNTQYANTLESLQIMDESRYICYRLQARREQSSNHQDLLTWDIQQHKLDENIIPDNSLIFLFNPELIAGLQVPSWQPENLFRLVPTILIDPHASVPQLERAMVIARLAALDIDPVHRKKTTTLHTSTPAILTVMQ